MYFDWVGKDLGLSGLDDWHKISFTDIAQRDGAVLLKKRYDGSLTKALMTVYPGKHIDSSLMEQY
jgi:hypothetical protein